MARLTPTWVYAITCGEHTKIGIATDVEARRRGLQGSNPHKVEVFGHRLFESYSIARRIEAELHAQFAEHRGYGEWFAVDPEAVMASLRQWDEYQRAPETTQPPPSYVPPKSSKRPSDINESDWRIMKALEF